MTKIEADKSFPVVTACAECAVIMELGLSVASSGPRILDPGDSQVALVAADPPEDLIPQIQRILAHHLSRIGAARGGHAARPARRPPVRKLSLHVSQGRLAGSRSLIHARIYKL